MPTQDRAPRRTPRRAPRYTARTADKYELYQLAVQSPDHDVEFLTKVYRRLRQRAPRHFREDFCGTAALCAEWVRQSREHTAEGFDLDPEPLAWGREHNLEPLGSAARRVVLHRADVRAKGRPADVRAAQNFSYCIFKERAVLLDYFRRVRRELAPDGLFAIDLYGGTESTEALEEPRRIDGGFTYVWDQYRYLPGSGEYTCYIHFRFRDGTELKRAFRYDWRLWTAPELKDLLREAGFSDVKTFFEQSDGDSGEGNGDFVLDETGRSAENCAGWIAYLIALK